MTSDPKLEFGRVFAKLSGETPKNIRTLPAAVLNRKERLIPESGAPIIPIQCRILQGQARSRPEENCKESMAGNISSNEYGEARNPFMCIVGCTRSGTTLLQRMLNNHPQLAVVNDSHFAIQVVRRSKKIIDPLLTPELVEKVRSYPRFPRLGLSDEVVAQAASASRTYSEFVSALYSDHGRLNGKQLAGEKSPGFVRHLPRLHGLFPWMKTIHIIRDGRDVALSMLEWTRKGKGPAASFELWTEEPIAVCALWWLKKVKAGLLDGRSLSPTKYCEVGYEELVATPEQVLRQLSDFMRLPYAREMLDYHVGKTRNEPELSTKQRWLPVTPGLRDWRTRMNERDLELFEALAGDLLSDLGYERAFASISTQMTAVADYCKSRGLARRVTPLADAES